MQHTFIIEKVAYGVKTFLYISSTECLARAPNECQHQGYAQPKGFFISQSFNQETESRCKDYRITGNVKDRQRRSYVTLLEPGFNFYIAFSMGKHREVLVSSTIKD